eukprot:12354367-Karenia_brevis.AAC.1
MSNCHPLTRRGDVCSRMWSFLVNSSKKLNNCHPLNPCSEVCSRFVGIWIFQGSWSFEGDS